MNPSSTKEYTQILEKIIEADQQAIKGFKAGKITAPELIEVNKKNVEIVKKIISKIGFPTIDLTSQKAYKAAVLVVLHSEDIELLNQSIKDLQKIGGSSIQKRDIAYMIDKSRVIKNMPQLFGTQYQINKDGVLKFNEIEHPEGLEKRRAEYEMESFEEYKETVEGILRNK